VLHEFLSNNRAELTGRCRAKVAQRQGSGVTASQLDHGVPLFLDQLIRTLRAEQADGMEDSLKISGAAGGAVSLSEIGLSAAQHGKELLALGFTVDEVVHDYGDLCQAITDLALERDAPFLVDEFRTMNRCLDNAIADAVTEFSQQRDVEIASKHASDANQRMGHFVHEMRNMLGTAMLAYSAARSGSLNLSGATGSILKRSLDGLGKLIDESLDEIRCVKHAAAEMPIFSLAEFIGEVRASAELAALNKGCILITPEVDATLGVRGNRELLLAAVANLLQNAFKFTHPHSEVALCAFASASHICIEVRDHCGGLAPGVADSMFAPFMQCAKDRTGLGLGLTIARQSVIANDGTLAVRDIPGVGCIFTIALPRMAVPG